MTHSDMSFSADGSAAKIVMISNTSDIVFVVEDVGKEYFYETIFNKITASQYQFNIITTGGKAKGYEIYRCLEADLSARCKNVLFLFDGDFDKILRKNTMIESDHCVYLPFYNIECGLISESAVISFIKPRLKACDQQLREVLNFSMWKDTITSQASKLFLLYCYIQKHHPGVQNVSRPPELFLDSHTGFQKNDNSFDIYQKEYSAKDADFEEHINELRIKYFEEYGEESYYNMICGKFLLASLRYYAKSFLSENGARTAQFDACTFEHHLAHECNERNWGFLTSKIASVART